MQKTASNCRRPRFAPPDCGRRKLPPTTTVLHDPTPRAEIPQRRLSPVAASHLVLCLSRCCVCFGSRAEEGWRFVHGATRGRNRDPPRRALDDPDGPEFPPGTPRAPDRVPCRLSRPRRWRTTRSSVAARHGGLHGDTGGRDRLLGSFIRRWERQLGPRAVVTRSLHRSAHAAQSGGSWPWDLTGRGWLRESAAAGSWRPRRSARTQEAPIPEGSQRFREGRSTHDPELPRSLRGKEMKLCFGAHL
jgi:hypothetical protein